MHVLAHLPQGSRIPPFFHNCYWAIRTFVLIKPAWERKKLFKEFHQFKSFLTPQKDLQGRRCSEISLLLPLNKKSCRYQRSRFSQKLFIDDTGSTNVDGRRKIAIGHVSDSDDLNIRVKKWLDDENKQQHVMINMELHKEYKMNILQYKCII